MVSTPAPTLTSLRQRRDAIVRLATRRRASRIRVFGSVARGDSRPGSDVDFLVDFHPEASLLDQAGLIQDLEELLDLHVDVVSSGALLPRDQKIRAEAVDL